MRKKSVVINEVFTVFLPKKIAADKKKEYGMDTRNIAQKIVEESIVLLKNEECLLPLTRNQKVAFFGRAQVKTFFSGNGSGAAKRAESKNILAECEKRGLSTLPELKTYYYEQLALEEVKPQEEFDYSKAMDLINSGIMYELFGKYNAPADEYDVSPEILIKAKNFTETAILVLGRNSGGEECDRHLEEDYELTASEKELVNKVCGTFDKVVLILNINGLIDLEWIERYSSIKSILFIGIPGEEGSAALAKLLLGEVTPSGKLPVTIARRFEDNPSAKHFSWDKDADTKLLTYESYGLSAKDNGSVGYEKSPVTVYQEDIYAGYRYFDTFGYEPLFPFGYGLSYTNFEIRCAELTKKENGFEVGVLVKNIGDFVGKEVVQLYLSALDMEIERPYQELKGFEKTQLLLPGDEEKISIFVPWKEMCIYNEKTASYVIEKGSYLIRLGNSSRQTNLVGRIDTESEIIIQHCENRLCLQECNHGKIDFLSQKRQIDEKKNNLHSETVEKLSERTISLEVADVKTISSDIKPERKDHILKDFSVEELAALCVGYGPGTPFSAFGDGSDPETIFDESGRALTTNNHPNGFNGYVSPAIEAKGIRSVFYKDGPAGIGRIAWPTEMLIACAFDRKTWQQFGDGVGYECEQEQVDFWLAPAVNLHRNPLGGRNFEYFSEDPYLTGVCAYEVTKGVQANHPVCVCPKHLAINEQETYRRGNTKKNYDATDSIITERAAREIYLKPFEMLVRDKQIMCIMTSFNKINGVFAGGNKDLCTHILRDEWGFEGAVITDWGDMDVVVDGADAVAAGNDIVMPGGPPVITQILNGYHEGRVMRSHLEASVEHLKKMIDSVDL